jgi:hypothetical protein
MHRRVVLCGDAAGTAALLPVGPFDRPNLGLRQHASAAEVVRYDEIAKPPSETLAELGRMFAEPVESDE